MAENAMFLEINFIIPKPPIGLTEFKARHIRIDISGGAVPDERDMQSIGYAAKMAYAKALRGQKRLAARPKAAMEGK